MKCWRFLKKKKLSLRKSYTFCLTLFVLQNLLSYKLLFRWSVRWAGSNQKVDLSGRGKTLTTKSLCLGNTNFSNSWRRKGWASCHGDGVALWRSTVTADFNFSISEVTQNCFEKICAQFCPFTMAIEEHLDLNQSFGEPLLEAFRYCISSAFCTRKRPMKTGSLKSFHTNPHTLAKKFAPKIYQGLAWSKCNCAISL